jgi:hypothetical protein
MLKLHSYIINFSTVLQFMSAFLYGSRILTCYIMGADLSPPSSAEVKKMWIYTFTPAYVFMA